MLDALKQTGQLDNTLIVFLSDNGMPFANAKTNLYDAGVRLPLLVRSPDQAPRGLVNNAMVSWVDLLPTFLDWSGAKGPNYRLHGRSFLPVLGTENPSGWDEVYFSHTFHEITMYYPMRGMRTRQYKYIRNIFSELEYPHATDLWGSKTWQSIRREGPAGRVGARSVQQYLHRPAEELYDITKDPLEVNNLAGKPEHKETLSAMHRKVHEFRRQTKDPWTLVNTYQGEPPGDSAAERELGELARPRESKQQ
jgi:N-sulfoglucosamine sulfohydrolase